MGVQTVQLTEARGQLAGALIVRDGYQVMLISNGGTVIKMPVEDITRLGRSTQGVIVMRLRGDETVSSIARVTEPAAGGSGRPGTGDGHRARRQRPRPGARLDRAQLARGDVRVDDVDPETRSELDRRGDRQPRPDLDVPVIMERRRGVARRA